MTVSPEYRARNRTQILRVAARLFRAHGFRGVNVDRIMAEAGLTRGTFYTYFKSKKALFAEAITFEPDFQRRMAERDRSDLNAEAIRIVSDYLNPVHRHLVWPGCALASLSQDAARADEEKRTAFAATLKALVAEFGRGFGDENDPRALQAVAMAVGGIVLARASEGDAVANRISFAATDGVAKMIND